MGGGGTNTTTQQSTPWSGQQPYLRDLFGQAQGLYQSGQGQEYYPGTQVAPFSPQTQAGFDMITDRAIGGSPQQDAFGSYLQSQLGQPNINPWAMFDPSAQAAQGIGPGQHLMHDAAGAMQGMTGYGSLGDARGYAGSATSGSLPAANQYVQDTLAQSPSFGAFADEVGGRLGQGAASQLADTAAGKFLGSNPYLDQVYDTAASRAGEAFQEQTMPALAAQFGSAGRTGSGIHQEMGQNAARQFGRDLQGMASSIYAPAYEAERGRMVQAGSAGGNLDMSGLGLSGSLYGGEQQRRLGAAGLGGDLFSRYNADDLSRLGLGSSLYLGERGLGQDAASRAGGLQLGAGQGLGTLGMQGVGAMNDLYGNIAQNRFRAGSLVPSFTGLQYGDMDRMLGVGGAIEDQAQRLINADMSRHSFEQMAPWNMLNNYANTVYGLPAGYGTQMTSQPTGSRLQGAAGGALAGMSLGPWGALGGAVLGGLL